MSSIVSDFGDIYPKLFKALGSSEVSIINAQARSEISLNFRGYSPRFYIALNGQVNLEVDSVMHVLKAGSALVAGNYEKLNLKGADQEAVVYEFVHNANSLWIRLYEGRREFSRNLMVPLTDQSYEDFNSLWAVLLKKETVDSFESEFGRSFLKILLGLYEKQFLEVNWQEGEIERKESFARFAQIQAYVARNLTEDLNLHFICQKFQLPVNELTEIVRTSQKATFKQMVILLRLNKSRKLLIQQDCSIPDLAAECGFNSDDHFIYTFKQNFGISPKKQTRLLLNGKEKSHEELQELHELRYYSFIPERRDNLPQTLPLSAIPVPTVCYIINETAAEVDLYYLCPETNEEIYLQEIIIHERCHYNMMVNDIIVLRDKSGTFLSWFLIEDRLCQALITA